MAHWQHVHNLAEQITIHIFHECFGSLMEKVETANGNDCNINKMSAVIGVNKMIAFQEPVEEYAQCISKVIIKDVLRQLWLLNNSCKGNQRKSVVFSHEIVNTDCDVKFTACLSGTSTGDCVNDKSWETETCLEQEKEKTTIDSMIAKSQNLRFCCYTDNTTISNLTLNMTETPYVSSACTVSLNDYSEELSSFIMKLSMESMSCTFNTFMKKKLKLLCYENQGNKPINDDSEYGRTKNKTYSQLPVSVNLDKRILDGVTSDDNISLCDTFLPELFSQTCDQVSNSSSLKWKKSSNRAKSRKLSNIEKKKKKLLKKLAPVEIPEFNEMGFKVKSDSTENGIYMSDTSCMYCPVCLDIYYRPYNCMPCTHTFCEPCLRRLSKYNTDKNVRHSCPICRVVIEYCEENKALNLKSQSWAPDEYRRRQITDGNNKYMNHPLPSKPTKVSLKNIANIIRDSNRSRQQQRESHFKRFCNSILTLDFWKLLVLLVLKCILLAGMIWFCNLLSNEGKLNAFVEYYRNRIWNYSELSAQEQNKITNDFVVLCSGICATVVIAGYVSKRLMQINRR